jgi:4-amino-4-deoxy-L-arabinose transferase-like glycosyltransferase
MAQQGLGRRKAFSFEWLALAAILLAALALRLWGIGFGLPYEYHPDEEQYVRQSASMGVEGLEPKMWNNPPFLKYILLGEYAGLYVGGRALGWYASAADFGAQSTVDPTLLLLLGRATSALSGALTVLLVFWIGQAAHGRRTGFLAAVFLAVAFIHVRDSHYAVNDALAAFFVTLALLGAVRVWMSGATRWYLLAGIALGLGFATKYSAIFAGVPVLLAHFLPRADGASRTYRAARGKLLGLLAAAAACAVVASPYFVLTPGNVIRDAYQHLAVPGQSGFWGWQIDAAGGYLFYLKSLVWGLGWPLFLLAVGGLVLAVLRHHPCDVIVASLPITIYLVAGRQQMYFARFILPAVPALLILAASALDIFTAWAFARRDSARLAATGLIAAGCIAWPVAAGIRHDYLLTQIDTRTETKAWIESRIPANSKIAVDWPIYGPPLSSPQRTTVGSGRA